MFVVLAEIPGYPSYYADLIGGRLWSMKKKTPKLLAGGFSEGYRIHCLMVDGKQVMRKCCRLVAIAAYGLPSEGMETCHRNGKRDDDRAENLKWGTQSENNGADKLLHGRLRYGDTHQNSKLTFNAVLDIRSRRASGTKLKVLADEYGVTQTTISRIYRNLSWEKME